MSRNVAVLMGGWSSEREVSLVSGAAVADALRAAGYRVTAIDVQRDVGTVLSRLSPRPDAVFNALHGRYGEDGWEAYWRELFANGGNVTEDWETAYYGEFVAGGGERSMVTSYTSSPAAEVLYADPPIDAAPTGVITDTCYRQIEFAGILRGTDQPAVDDRWRCGHQFSAAISHR